MHTKDLGSIGELKIATRLIELGYSVFSQLGDNSEIDLITEKDGVLKKIQVKTTEKIKNGKMEWVIAKSRLNSKGQYKEFYKNIDCFCLYCLENDYIGFVDFSECKNKYSITLRIDLPKNKQEVGIKLSKDYSL